MTFYAVALALFAAACLVYYSGRLVPALLLEILFLAAISLAAGRLLPPALAWPAIALLALLPGAFLLVHVVDARFGIFLYPTIYSIAIAAIASALFLGVCGVALLF